MSEKLVIVGKDKVAINAVCKAVKSINPQMELEVVSSLENIVSKDHENLYKGFIIDFRTMLGCSSEHRVMSAVVEDIFPTAKYRMNTDGSFAIISSSYASDDLNAFINQDVKDFGARSVRHHERTKQNLPVRYSVDNGKTWEESCSEDVSLGGIFLVNDHNLPVGTHVLLEFTGKMSETQQKSLTAVVRWTQKDSSKAQGSGLEFLK